jgi:Cu-processing system permease protein
MTTFTLAQLTIRETQRRRILWLALLMGAGFLALFGLGFHYIYVEIIDSGVRPEETRLIVGVLLTAALYVINFLIVVMSVLVAVTAVSGEIDSHTIETMVTKPVHRWQIILGKWLGYALLIALYVLLLAGGAMLVVYLRSGFTFDNIAAGLGLMTLTGIIMLTVCIAGGTRLSSLANGALAFMLYGVAFIGGWVEQIGAVLRNETAVDIGIVAGLLMPSEVLWKKAILLFNPQAAGNMQMAGPFAVSSQPSDAMIAYAFLYTAALLLLALWSFSRRDL